MKAVLALCVVCFIGVVYGAGGLGDEHQASAKIQTLVDGMKDEILKRSGLNGFSEFKAISYKEQVVAGMNYFVKIQVGANSYIHARLYVVPWRHSQGLTAVQINKSLQDPIEYF